MSVMALLCSLWRLLVLLVNFWFSLVVLAASSVISLLSKLRCSTFMR